MVANSTAIDGCIGATRRRNNLAKLINPVLFSSRFELDPDSLAQAGLFDPLLNSDSKLFIDPLLLRSSANRTMAQNGERLLRSRFEGIIRLIAVSETKKDAAWRAALSHLNLSERSETCLG